MARVCQRQRLVSLSAAQEATSIFPLLKARFTDDKGVSKN